MPHRRPTALQLKQYLDKLIKTIVSAVKSNLPDSDQQVLGTLFIVSINNLAQLSANTSGDPLENEIIILYQHLLSRPAAEVDQLINHKLL